jgi:hypothetical protein
MPRIRSLKPEHKQHRKVGRLSHLQYRLWIGMISEADDEGRFVADADQLRAQILPYASETVDEVAQARDQVALVGLIRLFSRHGTTYGWFPSWHDHQRLDRPKPSLLPIDPSHDRSSKRRRTIDDASTMNRADRIGSDRKGSDRKGGEWGGKPKPEVAHATNSEGPPIAEPRQSDYERGVRYLRQHGITLPPTLPPERPA